MIYYTYLITNTKQNKYYIGSRQCEVDPEKDLGVKYFSSSADKDFKQDQKKNPNDYEYRVLELFSSCKECMKGEVELHETYKVSSNPSFYNKANQTSVGFNVSGMVSVKDKDGNTMQVSVDDPRYLSRELVSVVKGTVTVKDKDGNMMRVSVDDPRYLSRELVSVVKGTVSVKDKDGNTMKVDVDDPRYLSGELEHIFKGTVTVKDKDGNTMKVPVDDPRYKSGELAHNTKGTMWINNTEEKRNRRIKKTDPIPTGWVKGRNMNY